MHNDSYYIETFFGAFLILIFGLYLSFRKYLKDKQKYSENYNSAGDIKTFPGFSDYYFKYIESLNVLFENKRLAYLNKVKFRILIFLCLIIVNVTLYFEYNHGQIISNGAFNRLASSIIKFEIDWYPFAFIGYVLFIYWVFKPSLSYNNELKSTAYPKIFEFFDDVTYRYKIKPNIKDFSKFVIIPDTCRQICKHEISGHYKDINFYSCWCELIDCFTYAIILLTPSYSWRQFKGLIITFNFKQKFTGTTVVKRVGTSVMGLDSINIPDSNFSNKFVVFSDDSNQAVRLVTNSFLQNLQKIGESFSATYIEASFADQKLLLKIGLNTEFIQYNDLSGCNLLIDSEKILQMMQLIHSAIDSLTDL